MKKVFAIATLALAMTACNSGSGSDAAAKTDSTIKKVDSTVKAATDSVKKAVK